MEFRFAVGFLLLAAPFIRAQQSSEPLATLHAGDLRMVISADHFRFGFDRGSAEIAAPHAASGIEIGDAPLANISVSNCSATHCSFAAVTSSGGLVHLAVDLEPNHCVLSIDPSASGQSVVIRTAGISPAFGLGDRAAASHRDNTDLTGLVDNHLISGFEFTRLASNFVIFPRQGIAEVLPWPKVKIARFTAEENAEGVASADGPVVMHYFFGTPHEIYAAYAAFRWRSGYDSLMPKYEMFGVGWEAFGALAWDTNQQTIRENVDHYLALGYPLQWMVIGSGFWPAQPDDMHETTSFGLWDSARYPTPRPFLQHFHDEHLKILLGLRITFITTGPFAAEGVRNHYFLEENGQPRVFKTGWPKLPCYLLDAQSPQAVDWYLGLVSKWTNFGVDGFKEDFFGFGPYDLRDDKVDSISERLMALGYDLIERNGYLASNGDLERINDFNFDQDQDRGPVNSLALAYSGLPLVYPDIVGGTFGEQHFSLNETTAMDAYMKRNAQWAAMHPSLSMGQPPWSFHDPEVGKVMSKAAQIHERLHPYIFSQAVRFIHDGYPWTMTPLPIAFSDDPHVYNRENSSVRGYEWMIGDALLATPLYGNDYATATTRDIYLPRGLWFDYDTGERFEGPTVLKNHLIPFEKTPLFVGGTGIVIEQNSGSLVARIYPVDPNAQTEFWSSDAHTHSTIELHVHDWSKLTILDDTTDQRVAPTRTRLATEFPFVPGHSYRVE